MILEYFKKISSIPRGSRNNEGISNFLVDFAKEHGLEYIQDDALNVVIYKDATPGYEKCEPLILQGHMDMVCEKETGSTHDFLTEGISIIEEDGFLHADGTTLGGDDGIAVAYMLEYLADDSLVHPPLEMVITTDEEIGMYGAAAIDASVLKGRRMINIDSEEEGIFTVSCAGGLVGEIDLPIRREGFTGEEMIIRLSGLRGGHSGIEIDKNRWNAVKTLGRFMDILDNTGVSYKLIDICGGRKDNVIPGEAVLRIAVDPDVNIQNDIRQAIKVIKSECIAAEPGISFDISYGSVPKHNIFDVDSAKKLKQLLTLLPCGVQVMSAGIPGMVESSCNIGVLNTDEKNVRIVISMRSSKKSYIDHMSRTIEMLAGITGAAYKSYGGYPGWDMKEESSFRDVLCEVYKDTFGKDPVVEGVHAGLEGGLFVEKIPDMDIVSIGPDMYDIHTTNEKIDIASVGRLDRFLRNVIERLARG